MYPDSIYIATRNLLFISVLVNAVLIFPTVFWVADQVKPEAEQVDEAEPSEVNEFQASALPEDADYWREQAYAARRQLRELKEKLGGEEGKEGIGYFEPLQGPKVDKAGEGLAE